MHSSRASRAPRAPKAPKAATRRTPKRVQAAPKRSIRLTHVPRSAGHDDHHSKNDDVEIPDFSNSSREEVRAWLKANPEPPATSYEPHFHAHGAHGHHTPNVHDNVLSDPWYSPDQDSEHEGHFPTCPSRGYVFATTKYSVSFRLAQKNDQVFKVDAYEGETFSDILRRFYIPVQTLCDDEVVSLREDQFEDGPNGCGKCIGIFPKKYHDKLPAFYPEEGDQMRQFIQTRVNHEKTAIHNGNGHGLRFLCVTQMTPDLDGVEIYIPGSERPQFGLDV